MGIIGLEMPNNANLTKPSQRAKIGAKSAETTMQELIGRVERLECIVQELGKARRDASLLEVDRIEREFDLKPRTAELRQRSR